MKKTLLFVAASALLATVAATSCGNQKKVSSDTDSLTFGSITLKSIVPLKDGSQQPACELDMQIKYAQGPNADRINDSIKASGIFMRDFYSPATAPKSLPQYADSFAASYVRTYKRDVTELKKMGANDAACSYNYVVKTSVGKSKDGVINYLAQGYSFTGGAHGMSFVSALNFDPKTGKKLSLDDVFTKGSDKVLMDKVIENIAKKFGVSGLAGLKTLGIFDYVDVRLPESFILGTDSVTFIYETDAIAPHAVGEIRSSLAYKDLTDIMPKVKK